MQTLDQLGPLDVGPCGQDFAVNGAGEAALVAMGALVVPSMGEGGVEGVLWRSRRDRDPRGQVAESVAGRIARAELEGPLWRGITETN